MENAAAAVTDVVSGLAPSAAVDSQATDNPVAPSGVGLAEVLGSAGREIEQARDTAAAAVADHGATAQATHAIGSTFFASEPVLAYNAAQNVQASDGVITGTLNGSQANGYALSYFTSAPQKGTVAINPDSTFAYTPNAEFVSIGGTDTYEAIADDRPGNPLHWHGLLPTLFAPDGGHTAVETVTVLENPNFPPPFPTSVLATTDQLAAERRADELSKSWLVQTAAWVMKLRWMHAAKDAFSLVGGPDEANMAQLDQAVDQMIAQTAFEVIGLNSNNPVPIMEVAPPVDWYLQSYPGSRIFYDQTDTIYQFTGVNGASSYVFSGKFDDLANLPTDYNFSVLTGLSGTTASFIGKEDLDINPDGTFQITADPSAANGRPNHLQVPADSTFMLARNTMADWNTEEPMSWSVLRVSGPPDSLFSQIGGFAIPFIGPLVVNNPFLTELVSIIPPLPDPFAGFLQELVMAVILPTQQVSLEDFYIHNATNFLNEDGTVSPEKREVNKIYDPQPIQGFLASQLLGPGYFQLEDDEALVVNIDLKDFEYFNLPVYNDWTLTNNYWDEQTALNIDQSMPNPDGTYTLVVSKNEPIVDGSGGVFNWISTGGLNQGTFSTRFVLGDPENPPHIETQVVKIADLGTALPLTTVYVTPEGRQEQIAERQLGFNRRYWPYPQT